MFRLMWNFDKQYYSPSEKAIVNLWAVNEGTTEAYISEVEFHFEFGIYTLPQTVSGIIPPLNSGSPNRAYLGKVVLTIPPHTAGLQTFSVRYRLYYLQDNHWVAKPVPSKKFTLNIIVTPIYKIFLSRGLNFEDRIVVIQSTR